jgi:hypothetical protein
VTALSAEKKNLITLNFKSESSEWITNRANHEQADGKHPHAIAPS